MPRYQNPLELHGFDQMIEDGLKVSDIEIKGLLIEILIELRHLNVQMELITDEEVEKC